jgi:NAD(P)-dependent dehydrogenase (short-subunit alcohol dehydrogenase family)
MNLSGRTILITGAAQGIGKAISKLCSDLGANVVLADRNLETLQETLKEFPADRTEPFREDDPCPVIHPLNFGTRRDHDRHQVTTP